MVLGWERNIDLELASAGSEEAVRERVHVFFLASSCTKLLCFHQK